MHLHEYQAKTLLQKYGIPTPEVIVCSDEKQIAMAIEKLSLKKAVIKAQVHSGQRKKHGGIKFAQNPDEIYSMSRELLGKKFVSHQTPKEGILIEKVLITAFMEIEEEYYLSFMIDRKKSLPICIASKEGGIDIEENKESLLVVPMRFDGKLYDFQLFKIIKALKIPEILEQKAIEIIKNLSFAFSKMEATLLEINPLALTKEGYFLALDAKCSIDDNSLFREAGIAAYFDPNQLSEEEVLARNSQLSYVSLQGEIGCLVNGAGLAMATLDLIHQKGGKAANFLDIGGSASVEKIQEGFKILLKDQTIKVILIHIFGGILDCKLLVEGLLMTLGNKKLPLPLVVRLEGNHSSEAKHLLKMASFKTQVFEKIEEAVEHAIEIVSQVYGHINSP